MFSVIINETCYTATNVHIDQVVYCSSHDQKILDLAITGS